MDMNTKKGIVATVSYFSEKKISLRFVGCLQDYHIR